MGWLAPGIPRGDYIRGDYNRGDYIKASTLLACRHHQLEIANGERGPQYLEGIARYRQQVHGLLARATG